MGRESFAAFTELFYPAFKISNNTIVIENLIRVTFYYYLWKFSLNEPNCLIHDHQIKYNSINVCNEKVIVFIIAHDLSFQILDNLTMLREIVIYYFIITPSTSI